MGGQEPFVGRGAEVRALATALAEAEVGRGPVAFVAGEPGIGKTRLVTEATTRAPGPVLWARCWQGAGAPAFWPWQQLLRALSDDGTGASIAPPRGADGRWEPLLDDAQAVDATEGARFRLFDAVVDLLAAASRPHPLVLVVDDLHWADEPSLRLLEFLGRDPRAGRLAVVGTYRDTDLDPSHALTHCLSRLAGRGPHVVLTGLGEGDVAALSAALAPQAADHAGAVSLLHRRTGGNPLFVRELLRLQVEEGPAVTARSGPAPVPSSVRAVIVQRLARLRAPTHDTLRAAAVIGEEFDTAMLASLTEEPTTVVHEVVDEASSAGLLDAAADASTVRFSHAVVREVLHDELPHPERARLHRRLADVLRARGGERHLPLLAHHLLLGAVDDEDRRVAADHAVRAGQQHVRSLAYEEAAHRFSEALEALDHLDTDEAERTDLHLAAAEAFLAAGDRSRAREAFLQAAVRARAARDADRLARAALGLGAGLGGFEVQLLDAEQVDLLREASAALGPEPSVLRAWVLARLSVAVSFMDSEASRQELSEAAVSMARQVGDPQALGYALAGHCDVIAGPDSCLRRREEAEEVVRLGVRAHDPRLELLGRRLRVVALLETGETAEADAEVERFARVADRLRQPLYRWYVPLWKGMRALMRGEPAEAARRRAEAEELGTRAGSSNAVVLTFTQWWVQQRYEGRFGVAGEAMIDLLGQEPPSAPPVTAGPRAVAAVLVGDIDKARVLLQHWSSAPPRERSGDSEWLPESAQLAETAVLVGDRDVAQELYGQLRPYAHLFCVEGIGAAVVGSVAWYLALLARFLGDDVAARAYEEQARTAHQRVGLVGDPAPLARAEPSRGAPPAVAQASLTRDGPTWVADYAGRTVRLRDTKGLRTLAALLVQPDRDVHCLELMGGTDVGGEPGPVLDQQARRAYERRVRELQEAIDDARGANDPVRAEQAEVELDAIVQQLSEAFGLSGRARATGSAAERARSAVGWRIRSTLRAVAPLHPELGRHLDNAVRTGTWCSYRPETAVRWDVHAG